MDPDALLHPVGPLSASTYWRRRLTVLLAVVVVLVIVVLAATAGGGGSSSQAGAPAPTPTTGAGHPPASPAATTPAPTTGGVRGCTDGDLAIRVTTPRERYPVATQVVFTLHVRNTSTTACRRDLGQSALTVVVSSGSDRIWASDDCAPGGPSAPTTLSPGEQQTFNAAWNGARSAPGCPSGQPTATAGTYRVEGRVGSAHSDAAVFHLEG